MRGKALRKLIKKPLKLSIEPRDQQILVSLMERFLPHTQVWAFGSRVTGKSRSCSDLDLVAFTKREQRAQVSLLKEAFDESNLSFRVDLLEWDFIPDSFKENIKDEYMEINNPLATNKDSEKFSVNASYN
jgi:predicted nucleotidyltransferase